MKKSRSVINVLVLCILIATFLRDILLHILQKEKIVSKNRPCSRGLNKDFAAIPNVMLVTSYFSVPQQTSIDHPFSVH